MENKANAKGNNVTTMELKWINADLQSMRIMQDQNG